MGLQGSWLRGEAHENSDIDIMVILDRFSVGDMDIYRGILREIGFYERSCGFICGKQEEKYWEQFTGRRVIPQSYQTELYFEEPEIDSFVKKLERLYPDIEYVNRLMTHSWGQRVVRFYDPDGNLIEVGTPV